MKTDIITFVPNASSVTAMLHDATMIAKAVIFQVIKDGSNVNMGIGFSTATYDKGGSVAYNTSKITDYDSANSILAYDGSTLKVKGTVPSTGFDTAGEITVDFTNYDSTYTVIALVLGE